MPAVTLPYNIGFKEWADRVRVDLPEIDVYAPPEEKYWQVWALEFCAQDPIDSYFVPNPQGFPDWKTWAEAACDAIGAV